MDNTFEGPAWTRCWDSESGRRQIDRGQDGGAGAGAGVDGMRFPGFEVGHGGWRAVVDGYPDFVRGQGQATAGGFHEGFLGGPEVEEALDPAGGDPVAFRGQEKFRRDLQGGKGGINRFQIHAKAAVLTDAESDPSTGVGQVEIQCCSRHINPPAGFGGDFHGFRTSAEHRPQLLSDPRPAVDPAVAVAFEVKPCRTETLGF